MADWNRVQQEQDAPNRLMAEDDVLPYCSHTSADCCMLLVGDSTVEPLVCLEAERKRETGKSGRMQMLEQYHPYDQGH